MHNFKKIIVSNIYFLIFFSLIYLLLISPYTYSNFHYFQDGSVLASLSGKIDFTVIGASNSECAYNIDIINHELDVNGYNLSSPGLTTKAKNFIFCKQHAINPFNKLILDISFETLSRPPQKDAITSDIATFTRFRHSSDRLDFLINGSNSTPLEIYSGLFMNSVEYLLVKLRNEKTDNINFENKGRIELKFNDQRISSRSLCIEKNSRCLDFKVIKSNLQDTLDLIRYAKGNKINIAICVAPVPLSRLWKLKNCDIFYYFIKKLASNEKIDFYDFNLLKKRFDLYSDKSSYADQIHLSKEGSIAFSKSFCEVIKAKEQGRDISAYFFRDYKELKTELENNLDFLRY